MFRAGHYFKTSFPMYDGSGHKEFCPGRHINFQHSRAYSNKSLLESIEASIAKGDLVVVDNRHQCDWNTGGMFMPTIVECIETFPKVFEYKHFKKIMEIMETYSGKEHDDSTDFHAPKLISNTISFDELYAMFGRQYEEEKHEEAQLAYGYW